VLTPAQLEGYRQFQETQLKMLKSFTPKGDSGAGALNRIHSTQPLIYNREH